MVWAGPEVLHFQQAPCRGCCYGSSSHPVSGTLLSDTFEPSTHLLSNGHPTTQPSAGPQRSPPGNQWKLVNLILLDCSADTTPRCLQPAPRSARRPPAPPTAAPPPSLQTHEKFSYCPLGRFLHPGHCDWFSAQRVTPAGPMRYPLLVKVVNKSVGLELRVAVCAYPLWGSHFKSEASGKESRAKSRREA